MGDLTNEELQALPVPSELHHLVRDHEHGMALEEVPEGALLVLTRVMADPGYGSKAEQQVDELMTTFAQIDGYLGHLLSHNEALVDEIWALVFGTSDMTPPIPDNPQVTATLYRRVRQICADTA